MKDLDDHKKIAVLIDADNAQYSKIQPVLEELSAHGHIVVKRAYGDWSSQYLKNWKTPLNELAIQPIQQFAYTTGKNSTDASLIIDAMDLLYSERFDAFALVSSDSDFTKLASRLKESEIFVFGFGETKTPVSFRNACDTFIYTEILGETPKTDETKPVASKQKRLIDVFTKAWEQYQDDDGWAQLGVAGNFAKRSHPDFDPRSYGAKNLSSLMQQLDKHFVMKADSGKGSKRHTIYMYQPIGE